MDEVGPPWDGGAHVIEIFRRTVDPATVLTCRGRLTFRSVPELAAAIDDVLCAQTHPLLVLDMRDVESVDSSGLGLILRSSKAAHRLGGALRLARPHPQLRTRLALSNLDSLIPVHDTVEDAAACCGTEAEPPGRAVRLRS